jgi:DNA-binding beta-propeller fold protein YncE
MKTTSKTAALLAALIAATAGWSCSDTKAATNGAMIQPQSAVVIQKRLPPPNAPDELLPFPHTFAYVTDTATDTVNVIDTTLRYYKQSLSPYFPLLIPVGSRPTRMTVTGDQSRIYVINSASKDISVIDTARDLELGAETWTGTDYIYSDPATGAPLRISTSLVMNDIRYAFSMSASAGRLYAAADARDSAGLLIVMDVQRTLPDGTPNPAQHTTIKTIPLPGVPGRMDASPDGDTVYLAGKTGASVFIVNVPTGAVGWVDLGYAAGTVRYVPAGPYNGAALLAVSAQAPGMWIIDLATLKPRTFTAAPAAALGTMITLQGLVPQDAVIAPSTSLNGALSTDQSAGCPGNIALVTNAAGGINAVDLDGCAAMYDAAGNQFTAGAPGFAGLPVESTPDPSTGTTSMPTLWVDGSQVAQDDMYDDPYPKIDGWDAVGSNFGFGMSTPFRAFASGQTCYLIYEGKIASGDSGWIMDGSAFADGSKDFAAAGAIPGGDWLVLANQDGTERTACDDGTPIATAEFQITAINGGNLTVNGPLPGAACMASPVAYQVRPLGMWSVSVSGMGLLGRASRGGEFIWPAAGDMPHFSFTVRDGTLPPHRDSVFSTVPVYNTMQLADTALTLQLPTDITVAADPVYTPQLWAYTVYAGSGNMYQFSPRTLDTSVESLYE